jgi:hypothetical protein
LQKCSSAGKCTVSCVDFCIDVENHGIWLDPACVANIKTCEQISNCPESVRPSGAK